MTIALRRQNGDILWFDAVEGFDEVLTSTVSKHPIATGAFVSDHITKDNLKFTLRGILSDADFNYNRPQMSDYNSSLASMSLAQETVLFPSVDKQYVNNTPTAAPVSINSNKNTFKKFLPESISQYTTTEVPEVVVTEQPKVKSASAVRMDLIQMRDDKELFTIVDFETNLVRRSWSNCVFTSLSFSENADGGDAQALFPVMEIEQVTFTDIEGVRIKVRSKNKGRQQGDKTSRPADAKGEDTGGPTELSKKSSQLLQGLQKSGAAS